MANLIWAKLKSSISKVFNGTSNNYTYVSHTFTNIRTPGYSNDNIHIVTPYGIGGLPVVNYNAALLHVENSPRALVCVGFSQNLPSSAYSSASGDSWHFGGNYITCWQGDKGIQSFRLNDNAYYATHISGEWVNKILRDLINDNNGLLRAYINSIIVSTYNAHTHPDNNQPPPLKYQMTNIDQNDDLASDITSINSGNTLINKTGTVP